VQSFWPFFYCFRLICVVICFILKEEESRKFLLCTSFSVKGRRIMWKKTSIVLALGLMWSPGSATAAGLFDPFAGIVNGIAQGLATGDAVELDSNYDGQGTVMGGNVVIGNMFESPQQSADVGAHVVMDNAAGDGVTQGVNVFKGEVAVLTMQGASIGGGVKMVSNSSKGSSVQGVNVITACGGAGCE
jgi:hypothetical protein